MEIYWKFLTVLWRVFAPLIRRLGWQFYAPVDIDDGSKIDVITPIHSSRLPTGTTLVCVNGATVVKGVDRIDNDARSGFLAYGFLSSRRSTRTYAGRYRER